MFMKKFVFDGIMGVVATIDANSMEKIDRIRSIQKQISPY